ncbi:DUF6843 domain-containing protein [Flavisolibacter tropicus]|uniref:DUF6843 domain-containing protein n=1 Tax=Flavisolibacter tropicus TaxID=1492898 RepID=A0A172TUJ2_9BACT|nr:hypothetical protein [Flavisolibacter tropicus]ANE50407.1 hypothetical protein SY85_07775 [Flavisolibacter tropicus]
MNKQAYWIGASLIVIAFIFAVISYYLLIFCIPLFVIGLIVVSFARVTIKRWILTCVLPVALWLPCSYMFLYAYGWNPKEVYLIPDGYTGPISIVYEEKCGTTPLKENGFKTFRVPDNGILIVNLPRKNGFINHEYYYLKKDGTKTKLAEANYYDTSLRQVPSVSFTGSGMIGSISGGEIQYSELWVFGHKRVGRSENESKVDSTLLAEVEKCRRSSQ